MGYGFGPQIRLRLCGCGVFVCLPKWKKSSCIGKPLESDFVQLEVFTSLNTGCESNELEDRGYEILFVLEKVTYLFATKTYKLFRFGITL